MATRTELSLRVPQVRPSLGGVQRCALRATLLLGAFLATGCPMSGNYHSARTLEKGTSSIGTSFSMTTFVREEVDANGQPTGEEDRLSLPNIIPELTYHIGVTDDIELGGRVAIGSLGLELDAKFRFIHGESLHVAVAPAIGYQSAFIVQGGSLRLPLIMTYDLSPNFALNVAAFAGSTHYSQVDSDFYAFSGDLVHTGFAAGIEIRGETFLFRPSFELTEFVGSFDDPSFEPFHTINVVLHVAAIVGREKKQLNRIERKIDRVIDNQEGRPHTGQPPVTDDSDYQPDPMR